MNRILFIIGLFLVLLSGLSIVLNHQGFALKLLSLSFLIMMGGTIFYLRELKNER